MWAYCESCTSDFVDNGGCELFGPDSSGRDQSYYFSDECGNADDICPRGYVGATLACTGCKFVLFKYWHQNIFYNCGPSFCSILF